jgi:beta-glucanase (GH16 family)
MCKNTIDLRQLLLPIGLLLACIGCTDLSQESDPVWSLVWQDEFEGGAGQLLDVDKWGYDIGSGQNGWGNAQLEYDTDRPENVSQDGNGNLVITARREEYQGRDYTSARILTKGLFEHTYGKFEARIKLPIGQGIWPAFWLLGANIDQVSWPQCGELDIMEYRGQNPSHNHGSLHGPGNFGGGAISNHYWLEDGDFSEDFHVFGLEWGSDYINWLVDDSLFHAVTPADLNGEWVFNHPFFIILNVAVGGNFVGPPDNSTTFPQSMLVDWVRVYEDIQ